MFRGVVTVEVGRKVREVRTGVCDSIRDVVHEVAKLASDGRIATCDIWMKSRKSWVCVKSVTME